MTAYWVVTYFSIGYVVAMALFGPVLFMAVLNHMVEVGRLPKLISYGLRAILFGLTLLTMAAVIGFMVRTARGLDETQAYTRIMAFTLLFGVGVVLATAAYVNKMIAAKLAANANR